MLRYPGWWVTGRKRLSGRFIYQAIVRAAIFLLLMGWYRAARRSLIPLLFLLTLVFLIVKALILLLCAHIVVLQISPFRSAGS